MYIDRDEIQLQKYIVDPILIPSVCNRILLLSHYTGSTAQRYGGQYPMPYNPYQGSMMPPNGQYPMPYNHYQGPMMPPNGHYPMPYNPYQGPMMPQHPMPYNQQQYSPPMMPPYGQNYPMPYNPQGFSQSGQMYPAPPYNLFPLQAGQKILTKDRKAQRTKQKKQLQQALIKRDDQKV